MVRVYLCQLGLVESRSGLQLVVSLVASQRVHLQLEKVHLKPRDTKEHSVNELVHPTTNFRLPEASTASSISEDKLNDLHWRQQVYTDH